MLKFYIISQISVNKTQRKNIYRATQDAMMEIANKAQCDFVVSDAMP